jgi:hypothetical protein
MAALNHTCPPLLTLKRSTNMQVGGLDAESAHLFGRWSTPDMPPSVLLADNAQTGEDHDGEISSICVHRYWLRRQDSALFATAATKARSRLQLLTAVDAGADVAQAACSSSFQLHTTGAGLCHDLLTIIADSLCSA